MNNQIEIPESLKRSSDSYRRAGVGDSDTFYDVIKPYTDFQRTKMDFLEQERDY
ncbi:MAG: hypothetical protein PHH54_01915 [Candidatus Nanoarchaeia archaeon]|nr:hypothetical protein [Candidatus Nanoarchaeia archaeon]MDD5740719.1 hypothetical protein [Candidatus Nanoarchaeia archaeon]